MSNELKPCPFCGSETAKPQQFKKLWQIGCIDCGVSTGLHKTLAEAITAWNRRYIKTSADFLWPVEKGSVEEAGYEFANAKTDAYQFDWWKILLKRASEIELIESEGEG